MTKTESHKPPPSMYCRQCGYDLQGLSENRCPECGQGFDPSNRRSFLRHPPLTLKQRLTLALLLVAAVAGMAFGGAGLLVLLCVPLYWRQRARRKQLDRREPEDCDEQNATPHFPGRT